MVITIDDGHKSNFDLMGLFEKFQITPTIYLCSQIVDTKRSFWWMTDGLEDRKVIENLKSISNNGRLEYLETEYGYGNDREYPTAKRQALKRSEIREMSERVDFGSHSRFHPILTECTDEECKDEISLSKEEIAGISEKECRHFSYPNGDYSEREINVVKRAGYLSARTTVVGWNAPGTDPFQLKVMEVADDASVNWLIFQVSGIAWRIKGLFERNGG